MGKYKRIMQQLAWLNARTEDLGQMAVSAGEVFDALYERVRELEAVVADIAEQGDDDTTNWRGHTCEFMSYGFSVRRYTSDDWRLCYDDDDTFSPSINFCPYCGVKLCEPEEP
jgi:hypothetical protein